ncbi:GNAT family N-acetyltransferase [Paenibacillus massiliensis]|uniref:GNAT family N-acetyltransferase n=1 Tax=Paenibacillus massiliensis TaxID=225917 RepID=UPI00036789C0|nr:GNAT family N-acetyltransferase [Paenibacillus massiliensis]
MNVSYLAVQATIHDLDDLVPLFDHYRSFYHQPSDVKAAREFLLARLEHAQSMIYIARDSATSQAVGFVQLYPSFSSISMKRVWVLNDLYVQEDRRRQGVAELLLEQARGFAVKTGAKGIELSTAPDNATAQALYHKQGYTKDDEFIHYFLDLTKKSH